MSNFTPGPWQPVTGMRSSHIREIKHVTVWNFLRKPVSAESQANARLIAAAPDMLAALQQIIAEDQEGKGQTDGNFSKSAFAALRLAVAKAMGTENV